MENAATRDLSPPDVLQGKNESNQNYFFDFCQLAVVETRAAGMHVERNTRCLAPNMLFFCADIRPFPSITSAK